MTRKTRVTIVGCGFFAQNHLHAWHDLTGPELEIAAVCDTDPAKAKAAAAAFSTTAYFDMAEMIAAERPDLIDIVTQVGSHKALVTRALDAGVATIVQKPFGRDLGECAAMLKHSEASGLFLAVHENFRFQRPHRLIKELIEAGRIGVPTWGRISFRTGYDIFAGQPYLREEERFVVTDVGIHVLDLARFYFGDVAQLSCELQSRTKGIKGEDTATILMRHTSGAVSVIEATYASRQAPDPFPATLIEIEGTNGALRLDAALDIHLTSGGNATVLSGDATVLPWAARPWHVVQDSVRATCAHILERLRAGKAAEVSAADNIRTYALCDTAYRAAATGQAVKPAW